MSRTISFHESCTTKGNRNKDDETGGVKKNDFTLRSTRQETITTVPQSLPLLCLREGLSRKTSSASLASWVGLALTLDGRDKITKTMQYSCRFLSWYLSSIAGADADVYTPYRKLYLALAEARKAFRLGRFLIEFQKLRKSLPQVWSSLMHRRNDRGVISRVGVRVLDSFYSFAENKASAISLRRDTRAELITPQPLWKTLGISCKLLGLAGFWYGDNLYYLSHKGFLPSLDKAKAKRFAERSYFFGALVGFIVNYKEIMAHRLTLRRTHDDLEDLLRRDSEMMSRTTFEQPSSSVKRKSPKMEEDGVAEDESNYESSESAEFDSAAEEDSDGSVDGLDMEIRSALKEVDEAREKQFVLFLALLKSTCDSLVFSNMPSIDLHTKYRGKKMNEGLVCLCGLTSAATVLYNNFPNKQATPGGEESASSRERRKMYRKHNFASSNWYSPLSESR